jgi:hypothetical protein
MNASFGMRGNQLFNFKQNPASEPGTVWLIFIPAPIFPFAARNPEE